MSKDRVLHLGIDEKFIDTAHRAFERVAPGRNDWMIFLDSEDRLVKTTPHKAVRYRDRLGSQLGNEIAAYGLVVIHSLHPYWISVINKAPAGTNFAWIGWGYDYYDLIHADKRELLLPHTRSLMLEKPMQPAAWHFPTWLRKQIEALSLNHDKRAAIARIRQFSPVLPGEYAMVRDRSGLRPFPTQFSWNYGSVEDDYAAGSPPQLSVGNIQLGHSAFFNSNHLDMIEWFAANPAVLQGRELVCPLSYGDSWYAEKISAIGTQRLGSSFLPMKDFLPLQDYVRIMSSCTHVILNSVRQEGVGNLLMALHRGAMVFLREESPSFEHFSSRGYAIRSIQTLLEKPETLQETLDEPQRALNRTLLMRDWSRAASDAKTSALLATLASDR